MDPAAQDTSEYYVWEPEGKSFVVQVHLDVIDALITEIMRGFGAVPKRGAEVGGVLLGSIESSDRVTVRIEDFEPVACGYTRGPSYLLSGEEWAVFEGAVENWRADAARASYAVGFFRSNTRDSLTLAPEDIELMDRCFAGAAPVVLLVKPYATKASSAGFFFRENGSFQQTTPLEFPFRRRELTGEEPPERRPLTERRQRGVDSRATVPAQTGVVQYEEPAEPYVPPSPVEIPLEPRIAYQPEAPRARRAPWMLVPLSFVFLLVGVALGFLASLGIGPRGGAISAEDYSLDLAVRNADGALNVQWNGNSAAVRNAARGVLEVHDGGYAKIVDLDASQLRGGKLAFHKASDAVNFRLTLFLNSRLSISETADWHQ